MSDVKGSGLTLEAQLRTEARTCPQCRLEITNPFTERCPRCLAPVPVTDPGCAKCVHNSSCPVSAEKKVKGEERKGNL